MIPAAPPRPRGRPARGAFSAVEILIASTLIVAAFLPIYTAIRSTDRTASLNDLHILARRRARRVMAHLKGHVYPDIKSRATGGAAPPSGVPYLPAEGEEIPFRLRTGDEEEADLGTQIADLPFGVLDPYRNRVRAMEVHAYFHEFPDEPGLGRIAVHVSWKDPGANHAVRHFVAIEFIEDPFHWSRT